MSPPAAPLSTVSHTHRLRFLGGVAAALILVGGFLYFETLRMSFAYDDVDFVNLTADVLAGKVSVTQAAFRPNGEHLIPVLRLAFVADIWLFGVDARPLRLVIFLAHLISGLFLALLARRYLDKPWVAGAAGLTYVGAGGLSSLWIWEPCGGGVPLGLMGVTGAMLAVAWRNRLGPRRGGALAGLGILWSLLCESTLAPLAIGPILLYEWERRRDGRKRGLGPLTLVSLGLVLAAAVATARIAVPSSGRQLSLLNPKGLLKSVFLLAVAPHRLLFPGTFLPRPFGVTERYPELSCLFGLVVAAILAAAFLAVRSAEARPLTRVAAISGIGPLGVVLLVGIGRFRVTVEDLYFSDRYFFTLLIPVSLLAGVLADGIRAFLQKQERAPRLALQACLVVFLAAELLLHRWAVTRRVPFFVYEQHETRFRQLALLAQRLAETTSRLPASERTIAFPDASIAYDDVHNGHLSTRVLLFAVRRPPAPRLVLGGRRVTDRDQAFLNPILSRWATEIGETNSPPLTIEAGLLVNKRAPACADFRVAAYEQAAGTGLFPWEGGYRWMGAQGELRLVSTSPRVLLELSTPWSAVHARYPDWPALTLKAALADPLSGREVELGTIEISTDAKTQVLAVPPSVASETAGQVVSLVLRSDRTWRPADVLSGSADGRALSVQIQRAGFCE